MIPEGGSAGRGGERLFLYFSVSVCPSIFFFLSFCRAHGLGKFPGQGSKPLHGSALTMPGP